MANVVVTGGCGYIGSHSIVSLCEAGHEVAVIDNLSRSNRSVIDEVEGLTAKSLRFVEGDVRDPAAMAQVFGKFEKVDCVVHFAAYKSVRESTEFPFRYYDNNVGGLIHVLEAMHRHSCGRIVFSSSCTVYGEPETLPVVETSPFRPAASPYGTTKQMCETILRESMGGTVDRFMKSVVSLRYFNPAGAHESARIGEQPTTEPENLVPYITQTAAGWRPVLNVFGTDYDTPDGTAIRDYIHVVDLAEAHVSAVTCALSNDGLRIYNIGTGEGHSVLEAIRVFQEVSGVQLPVRMAPRRAGDVGKIWSSCDLANSELGWRAKRSMHDIMRSAWEWQRTLRSSSHE